MVRRRAGFTLAEVVVALVLLGIASLALAGAAAAGRQALREAAAETRAVLAAASVLDSLARLAAPQPGLRLIGPDSVFWTVVPESAGSRIDLVVRFRDGSAVRALGFNAVAAPVPPRLRHDR